MGRDAASLNEEIAILQRQLADAHTPERVAYLQKRIRELKERAFVLGATEQKQEG